MIDKSQTRAARSHRFGDCDYFCRFCGRPLTHFVENGWSFCSAAWTGRREAAVSHWRFGPIQWTRVGVIYALKVWPFRIYGFVGGEWRLTLRPISLVEV